MAGEDASSGSRFLTAAQCLQNFNAEMRLAEQARQSGETGEAGTESDSATFQAAPRAPTGDGAPEPDRD